MIACLLLYFDPLSSLMLFIVGAGGCELELAGVPAPVFFDEVLEYLATEVLELDGIAARNDKKTRIIPRHIQLAIRFDDKLPQFLRDVMIPNGGVIPNIHNIFLPNKKNCSSKAAIVGGQEEEED
uniref:Histone H2A n=1 Tax=Solanum tuberosum TaxID=4113 RepID=M1DC05_SOLTU